MSAGLRLEWQHAFGLAKELSEHLAPHVVESKCVGSVRRRQPTVGDLEFVCRPHMQADLAGDEFPILDVIEQAMAEIAVRLQGGQRALSYTELFGLKGLKLQLFVCWPPASWGSLVAIRPGPWELSKHAVTMLAQKLLPLGSARRPWCANTLRHRAVPTTAGRARWRPVTWRTP